MELWGELIVAFAIKDKFDYIAAWFYKKSGGYIFA